MAAVLRLAFRVPEKCVYTNIERSRNMENLKIINKFSVYLQRLGYSTTTKKMLHRCVREFLEVQNITNLEKIRPVDIARHHEYLQVRPNKIKPGGLSENHIRHHIYALKTFFKWLVESGRLSYNPISGLDFPKAQSKPREILTLKEVRQLYAQCETYKERAVLSIYYGLGLRRSEGIKLDVKDVHFRDGLLYVREGKGAKRRVVPMSSAVARDIKRYIYTERKSQLGETALLVGKKGKRIGAGRVSIILKTLLKKAEIEKEISLHSLRHSIATHLLQSGLTIENVREFLGHQHLETTQIYTRISKKQLGKL